MSGETQLAATDGLEGREMGLVILDDEGATAVLVSSNATRCPSASVSVGIDQLAHRRVRDWRTRGRNEQKAAILSKVPSHDRFDADGGPVELELHLAPANQADAIP